MTQFIEPNKKSDLTAPRVLDWLQSLRSGLLSGFSVTPAAGFNVNITSGRVVIGGTSIHDDATRLSQAGLCAFSAVNQHVSLWVKYTYVDTFPPAAMTIGSTVTTGAAPAVPVIPVDAIKIADIFIPASSASLAVPGVIFINAPPLMDRGNADGDVLLERLINSNANTSIGGGGGFTYSGGNTVTWTSDIKITAPVITHRELYKTAALRHSKILAGSVGPPAPAVGPNSLLFALVDRRTPNTAATVATVTPHVLDLDAPDDAEAELFFGAATRDQIIVFGVMSAGVFTGANGMGALPPATSEPPPRFLGMDPGGAHAWESVDDIDLVGGLMSVADVTARNAIVGAQRKEGMVVYSQADDTYYVLVGGILNSNWLNSIQRTNQERYGVVSGCVSSAGAGTSINISAGSFYDTFGRRTKLPATLNVLISAPAANNVYALAWDPDTSVFKTVNLTANDGCNINDLPFAVVQINAANNGFLVVESVRRIADGQYTRDSVTVGTQSFLRANFASIRQAMLHIKCFDDDEPAPKTIKVVESYTEPYSADDTGCIRILPDATPGVNNVWTQPLRLSGIKVIGVSNAGATALRGRPLITILGTNNSFFFDMRADLTDARFMSFENLDFSYTDAGTISVSNHLRTLFRNVGNGFSLTDCFIDGNNSLSHVFAWSEANVELGGDVASPLQSPGLLISRCFMEEVNGLNGEGVFYFGDGLGTNTGTVTNIDGRLVIDGCNIECDNTDIGLYLVSTPDEATCDTDQFDISISNSSFNSMKRLFENCDNAGKTINASRLSNISLGIASNVTRAPELIGCTFGGTSVNLGLAGDVIGCVLNSGCTLTLEATNRISNCNFEQGTVTGVVGKLSNSTVNLGVTGLLTALAPNGLTTMPTITDCVITKANLNANSNTMLSLPDLNSACHVRGTQFSYTNTAITATTPMISMSASGSARLVMNGCTLNNPNGYRNSMTNAIVVTSTGDFRLMLDDCVTDMPLGFLQVLRASGTSGEVAITNCLVATDGQNAIDISTAGTGYLASVSISDSKFTCTATDPSYNIFHAKELFVTNNVFAHTNGDAAYTFGGTTATEGRQDVALINGNSFKGTSNGRKCDVYGDSYTKFMYDGNSQAVINGTNIATTHLQIGGQAFSRECTVANNQLTCDSNSGSGSHSSALVSVNGFAEIAVTGNSLYSGALGAHLSSYILLTAGRTVTCTGNTLLSTQNVANTVGNCYVSISAACAAAGDGNITVSSNAMEASVGGSGTGLAECILYARDAFAATVSGNVLRSRQSGTAATASISVDTTSFVVVDANVLRSSQNTAVTTSDLCIEAVATGNLLHANTGTSTLTVGATTNAAATGNTVHGSTDATLMAGTLGTTTLSGVATGNNVVSNSNDAVCLAFATQSALCGHNSLVAGTNATASAGTSRVGGSSASVIGNSLRCSTKAQLYCNNTIGTLHLNAIKNNTASSPLTEAIIGSNAAIGTIQGNTSTAALSSMNSAATPYTGGNNANI